MSSHSPKNPPTALTDTDTPHVDRDRHSFRKASVPPPTDTRTDTPPFGLGPRARQIGTQTHPWGPPVALTAAEQDGRTKAQTAATRSGPRRCPYCQRPSARPCPRRRPTSRASACTRAGAAAGPAAQAGGRGWGGAADQLGEGVARVLKTHPRPARRGGGPARLHPTLPAPPTPSRLLRELPPPAGWKAARTGSRILIPASGFWLPKPGALGQDCVVGFRDWAEAPSR